MMCGIYCITNKINNKIYIGQSNSVFTRWGEHTKTAYSNNKRKSLIHKAIKKYGVESFTFEILKLCEIEKLNELEIYYIKEFKKQGFTLYNLTDGGKTTSDKMWGETNPNAILTDEEIYDIRERYNNKENKKDVYNIYKDKITFNGFSCIWCGFSRKNIHMDVYTEENKYAHRKKRIESRDLFKNSNITEKDVKHIRDLRQSGCCPSEVYEEYQWIPKSTFNDIWYMHTFTNIKSNLEKQKTKYIRRINQNGVNNNNAKFTEEQIIDIRRRKNIGEKLTNVYKIYSFVSKSCFRKVWNNETYKNIGVINEIN